MHQIPTHLICKSKLTVKLISIIKSTIFCIIHQYNHLCESNISLLLHTPIKGSKKKLMLHLQKTQASHLWVTYESQGLQWLKQRTVIFMINWTIQSSKAILSNYLSAITSQNALTTYGDMVRYFMFSCNMLHYSPL